MASHPHGRLVARSTWIENTMIDVHSMQDLSSSALASPIRFTTREGDTPVEALNQAKLCCAPQGPAWREVALVAGTSPGWLVEDLLVDGHYIGIHLSDAPLRVQVGGPNGWRSVTMAPGSLWINREGQPFSLYVDEPSFWAGVVIKSHFLDLLLRRHYQLNEGVGIVDDMLCCLFRALIHQATPENLRADPRQSVSRSLIRTFVLALAERHGEPARESPCKGGLTRHQVKELFAWIEANLEKELSVEDMARCAGVSSGHFSREIKRATGLTPWAHVMRLRLQRAAALVREGEPICSIAAQCGFADHAHLSRAFRQHFGVAPREYMRGGAARADAALTAT